MLDKYTDNFCGTSKLHQRILWCDAISSPIIIDELTKVQQHQSVTIYCIATKLVAECARTMSSDVFELAHPPIQH